MSNKMSMVPSRILAKLRAGEVALCGKTNLVDPRAVEIIARCGFDGVWLCMEHGPNSIKDVESQIRAARMYGCDPMVRVRRGSYSDLIYPLELDAMGIMVPHIMSAADARNVVKQTRFHPIGRRAIDGGNADGAFCGIPVEEYIKQANEQRFLCVQIEDPEPMDELDEIAAMDGIDILFFGPGDYSHGIGKPGQYSHPDVLDARKRVLEAALRHGKIAGTVAGSIESYQQLVDDGFRFLTMGADVLAISQHFADIITSVKGLPGVASSAGSVE